MLTLILTSVAMFAFIIQPAKGEWTGTVEIRADGSVYPSYAPISNLNNSTYTLTDNITSYGDGIVVKRDNIVIDGAGHSIQGNGGSFSTGIEVQQHRTNVTVKNMVIVGFEYAVYLGDSSFLNISGNRIDGERAVCISDCSNVTLRNNTITGKMALDVRGMNSTEYFIHNIDTSNTVNGNPVYYLINQRDLVINSSTFPSIGYLALVSSTGITVEGLKLTNNGQGVLFAYTNNSIIRANEFTDNGVGVSLVVSSNNSICNNNASANEWKGVHLDWFSSNNDICENYIAENREGVGIGIEHHSSYNNVFGNNITGHEWQGIWVFWATNNVISGNNIADNVDGIRLTDASNTMVIGNNLTRNRTFGVYLEGGFYAIISNNTISGNIITGTLYCGICLEGNAVTDNYIYLNNVTNSGGIGIFLKAASDNMIYKNNFVNNTVQVQCQAGSVNTWDNGVEGNYWSDYNGTGPYTINADNQDNHPLTDPIVIPEFPSTTIIILFISLLSTITLLLTKKRKQTLKIPNFLLVAVKV
jgi:predicted secreted protein with PEFG-CTERM motif